MKTSEVVSISTGNVTNVIWVVKWVVSCFVLFTVS